MVVKLAVRDADGIPLSIMFSEEIFRSALSYDPNADDVFVSTFPKCGTTWATQMLLLIFRKGEPFKDPWEFHARAPYLESTGAEKTKKMLKPGVIKIHLPFHLTPWSKEAKYVCVARNPKDCCVSFFHYFKSIPGATCEGGFSEFFEYFMSKLYKEVYCGDYFDYLLDWYSHRNEPNILFLTYEEIKEDTDAAILKMASFVDDEKYAEPIRKDPAVLENIKRYSSIEIMRKEISKTSEDIAIMSSEDIRKSPIPDTIKGIVLNQNVYGSEANDVKQKFSIISNLARKGVIGDWKNFFSEEQSRRMNAAFAEKFQGTKLFDHFMKYM